MAYSDLDEIEGLVRYSYSAIKGESETLQKNVLRQTDLEQVKDQTWIVPVVCQQMPISEPEVKRARSTDTPLDSLDIIRAFCHPRVIATVSQILEEKFKS